jgi:hypothetical protein
MYSGDAARALWMQAPPRKTESRIRAFIANSWFAVVGRGCLTA